MGKYHHKEFAYFSPPYAYVHSPSFHPFSFQVSIGQLCHKFLHFQSVLQALGGQPRFTFVSTTKNPSAELLKQRFHWGKVMVIESGWNLSTTTLSSSLAQKWIVLTAKWGWPSMTGWANSLYPFHSLHWWEQRHELKLFPPGSCNTGCPQPWSAESPRTWNLVPALVNH